MDKWRSHYSPQKLGNLTTFSCCLIIRLWIVGEQRIFPALPYEGYAHKSFEYAIKQNTLEEFNWDGKGSGD